MQIVIVVSGGFVVFFFFKPMTAYEMRMSDWSSDVCSSDLPRNRQRRESYLHAPAKAEYPISIFPIVELNGHAPVSPCRARTERRGDHNRLTELFFAYVNLPGFLDVSLNAVHAPCRMRYGNSNKLSILPRYCTIFNAYHPHKPHKRLKLLRNSLKIGRA